MGPPRPLPSSRLLVEGVVRGTRAPAWPGFPGVCAEQSRAEGTAAGPDLPCPGALGSLPLSFRPAKVRIWESERAPAAKRSRGGGWLGDPSCSLVLARSGDAFASRGCGKSPAGPGDHSCNSCFKMCCFKKIWGGRSCRS